MDSGLKRSQVYMVVSLGNIFPGWGKRILLGRKRISARDKAGILELVGQNYLKVKNDMYLKEIEPCS